MMGRESRGFTLVEIVAALTVMGLIGGLIASTLSRQQRLYRATTEALEVRRNARDAVSLLAEEIRSSSSRDTIRVMTDSAIELFTGLGAGVSCGSAAFSDVSLAPTSADGTGLTSWLAQPDTGDLALVYRPAPNGPGLWERYRIRAVASRAAATACSGPLGFAAGAGSSGSSYVFTLASVANPVTPGAPVRFIRRGRYSLYRSSDGKWYLGYRRCNALGSSICGAIQPVSGYYQAYSPDPSRTGMLFRFFDRENAPLAPGSDPQRVSRIEIIARAASPIAVTLDGAPHTAVDSASSTAALRNWP